MSLSLGATIRSMRERKLMTQKDLGDLLGITAQAVSKWEIGKAEPDSEFIRRLCQIFDVSANELLGMHQDDQVSINETEKEGPEAGAVDADLEEMIKDFSRLSPADQQRVLDFVAGIISVREQ